VSCRTPAESSDDLSYKLDKRKAPRAYSTERRVFNIEQKRGRLRRIVEPTETRLPRAGSAWGQIPELGVRILRSLYSGLGLRSYMLCVPVA
jgi:hypothetical protein